MKYVVFFNGGMKCAESAEPIGNGVGKFRHDIDPSAILHGPIVIVENTLGFNCILYENKDSIVKPII